MELTGVDITQPYNWSTNTVAGILEDETYLGHTINLKSTTLSFKNKKRIERPETEQLRFENTHEALVTHDTWEIYRISASTNGAEPIWLSRISFLDWSTAWTVEAPWYCTGRTPWMR